MEPELQAIQQIKKILKKLPSKEAQQRVHVYVAESMNSEFKQELMAQAELQMAQGTPLKMVGEQPNV